MAIVGLAGQFPGADSIDALWDVLREGREAIERFEGEKGSALPDYDEATQAFGVVADATAFDHRFFGMSPAAARRMDPQHRAFLQCAWTALESGGIDITTNPGYVAVYGSCGTNPYYQRRVFDLADAEDWAGKLDLNLKSAKDHLATRVSYQFDLSGEAMTIQSACSSSLVAVHLACQSLLIGQSDMAIAGASSLRVSAEFGRGVSDGMQRAITRSATGRNGAFVIGEGGVGGDAVGVVVLKRLQDAIDHGDTIYAVIAGSALNNDGNQKVGYTAPSVNGLVDVVSDALALSGVFPEDIDFVECHGTGTDLGDAIELRALRRVFETDERGGAPLRIGAVKNNIGHTDAAAGIASLIKAALALHHEAIPPHTGAGDAPHHAQLVESPILALSDELVAWPRRPGKTRRAGVNSFAIGGTNAHIVLEEAPLPAPSEEGRRPHSLLVWSAKSEEALGAMTSRLSGFLDSADGKVRRADVERTLQLGRAQFDERSFAVIASLDGAADAVRAAKPATAGAGRLAFMLSGQTPSAVPAIASFSPEFVDAWQTCRDVLRADFGFDVAAWLDAPSDSHARRLSASSAVEYALGRALIGFGLAPDALIAAGDGVFAAAGLAEAVSVRDMLGLAHRRGEVLDRGRDKAPPPDGGDKVPPPHGGDVAPLSDSVSEPTVPLMGCDGEWVSREALLAASYWAAGAAVGPAPGFARVLEAGADLFVELGAGCMMSDAATAALAAEEAVITAVLGEGGDWASLCNAVGTLWSHGASVDWEAFAPAGRRIVLPTYPFERASFHIDDELRRLAASDGNAR